MIYYEFFDQDALLIIRYDGEISEMELSEFIHFLFLEAKMHKIRYLLNDLRKTIFGFNLEMLKNIVEVRTLESEYYSDFKSIHLINDSQQTTYSIIFKESVEKRDSEIVSCLTLSYAIHYLNLDIDEVRLEDRIRNLKHYYTPANHE